METAGHVDCFAEARLRRLKNKVPSHPNLICVPTDGSIPLIYLGDVIV